MKNQNSLIIGLFWVLLGLAFLADNLGWVHFSMRDLLNLWPLLLIALGFKFLPLKENVKTWIYLFMMLLFFGLLITGHKWRKRYHSGFDSWIVHTDKDKDESGAIAEAEDEEDEENGKEFLFIGDLNDDIKKVEVDLVIPATEFSIEEPTEKLYEFIAEDIPFEIKQELKMKKDKAILKFYPPKAVHFNLNNPPHLNSFMEMKLNPDIVWILNIESGAANMDLDLRKFKMEKVEIDSGASNMEITMGDRLEKQRVEINSGVSQLRIKVPKNVGVEVKTSNVLGINNISGLKKVNKGLFRSENFQNADKKIYIEVNSALSSFELDRY